MALPFVVGGYSSRIKYLLADNTSCPSANKSLRWGNFVYVLTQLGMRDTHNRPICGSFLTYL